MTDAHAVLVASGKGGVGKTLISINLAYALKARGKSVGLIDSDFSSSNLDDFLDLPETFMDLSGERFHPVDFEGLKIFSMSLLVGDKAVNMEGAQYSEMLRDAVTASEWGGLDYMVVDAPPGFGDIFKRTVEIFPNFLGCLIVSQPAHQVDLTRAVTLCKDLDVPIIGLVENMSYLPVGSSNWKIFGESTVDQVGEEYGVDVFGKIPLSMEVRKLVEERKPLLTGGLAEPIEGAVEKILTLEPRRPGFLERAKRWVKGVVDKALIEILLAVNREIDVGDVQKRFSYPGGSVVQLNFMKEDMRHIISQWNFMVYEGKLVAVEGSPDPDYRIDIKPEAIKWAMLGSRTLSDGSTYDFKSALRLGDMRVWGEASMARGAYFMGEVFQELSRSREGMERVRPILERI